MTSNDIFKGITLKQRKVIRENLAKEKKVREQMGLTEFNALDIIAKGLLTWHKVPKVIGTNKGAKAI